MNKVYFFLYKMPHESEFFTCEFDNLGDALRERSQMLSWGREVTPVMEGIV